MLDLRASFVIGFSVAVTACAATPKTRPPAHPSPELDHAQVPHGPTIEHGHWLGTVTHDKTKLPLHFVVDAEGVRVTSADMDIYDIPVEVVEEEEVRLRFKKPNGTWSRGKWSCAIERAGETRAGSCKVGDRALQLSLHRVRAQRMTRAELATLVGRYDTGSFPIVLTMLGDHLLRADRFLPIELLPTDSPNQSVADDGGNAHFEADGARLVLRMGDGKSLEAKRIERTYEEEEIEFVSGKETLHGTLRLPHGAGPHPLVVLVHGSGQGTRTFPIYETVSHAFADKGIASFVYDKRGSGRSTGDWQKAQFEPLISDLLAAVGAMKAHPGIDAKRIGLWGISQAGWLMPRAALRTKDISFIVSVSGAATSVAKQEELRVEHEMRADGVSEEQIGEAKKFVELATRVATTGKGRAELDRAIESAREKPWAKYPIVLQPGVDLDAGLAFGGQGADTIEVLEQTRLPFLAIYGEKDQIVPVGDNLPLLKTAMRQNPAFQSRVFPSADHAILKTKTGGAQEFHAHAENQGAWQFADGYMQTMVDWVKGAARPGAN